MANSPRMRWPYPSAGVDPWYDAFEDMVSAQDASDYALNEAKNIILSGGGTLSWSAVSGELSWTAPIVLNSAGSGYLESIPAGNVSVPADGMFGYVSFLPSPQSNATLTMQIASATPAHDPDNSFLVFRRREGRLFFRNGAVLQDGESAAIIDDGPTAGSGLITFQRDGTNFGVTDTLNFVGPLAVAGSSGGGVSELELQLAANSVEVTTTPYTVDTDYRAFYVNRASPTTVTLPLASSLQNQLILVKSVTANAVTVGASFPNTIDGAVSVTVDTANASLLVHSASLDGGLTWNWYVSSKTTLAGTGTVTDVTASAPLSSTGGTTPNISLTGTISTALGGTGITSYTTGDILAADSPTTLTKVSDVALGSVLLSGGVGAIPVYGKVGLTTHVTGVLPVPNGGTGFSNYAVGDLLFAGTTNTLSRLADVATGNVLLSGGVGTAPLYGKVGLTTHVSGILPVGSGGTGLATVPSPGQILVGTGTGYATTEITPGVGIGVSSGAGTIQIYNTGVRSVDVLGGTTGLTFSGGPVTTTGTITMDGTLGPEHGGTGIDVLPSDGQLLIGNGSGYTVANLVEGAGINITNGPGFISLTNTGVLYVGASGGTTGFSFTGSPITNAGTLTLTGTLSPDHGGTGISVAPTDGQLLIGSGGTFAAATLTAGAGINIVNGPGSITISSFTSGTVTSVTASAPLASSGGSNPNISLTGIVSPLKGGTGTSDIPAIGEIPIGNGATYTAATLTGGTGIGIVNGAGSITVNNTGLVGLAAVSPIVSTGGTSPTLTHANSGVGAGTYTNATVTVDSRGHVTAASSGTGGVSSVTASAPLASSGGANPNISLNTVTVNKGGTGITSYAVGDLLVADATVSLTSLPDVVTGNVLLSGGINVAPSYGKVGLSTHVSGTLPVANGGTGSSSVPANGQIPIGDGTAYVPATITPGLGVSITNGPGSITISASGAVFSFNMTAAEAVSVGKCIAADASGNAILADVTVAGRYPAIGICVAVVGPTVTVQPVGPAAVFVGLTPGLTYYVSTLGALDTAPPLGAFVAQTALQAFSTISGVVVTGNQPIYL